MLISVVVDFQRGFDKIIRNRIIGRIALLLRSAGSAGSSTTQAKPARVPPNDSVNNDSVSSPSRIDSSSLIPEAS